MVSFQTVLSQLLTNVHGSMAAMFFDHQGEAVEIAEQPLTPYDMKIVGAYEGIYLDQLRRICTAMAWGTLERFKLDWKGTVLFHWVLAEGYYLVLMTEGETNEALAWHQLGKCREVLLREIC